jgi:hypothetical protein
MRSIHIYPTEDWIEHDVDGYHCACGPRVEYYDDETGEHYPAPLVIHNAIDPDIE